MQQVESKVCRGCSKLLPMGEYYIHPQMEDGHLNYCIECVKTRVREHRAKHVQRIRKYDRERPKNKKVRAEYQRYYRKLKPKFSNARGAVSKAKKSGILEKKNCEVCGNANTEAHHENYDRPLHVVWLCSVHHKAEHKRIRTERKLTQGEWSRKMPVGTRVGYMPPGAHDYAEQITSGPVYTDETGCVMVAIGHVSVPVRSLIVLEAGSQTAGNAAERLVLVSSSPGW